MFKKIESSVLHTVLRYESFNRNTTASFMYVDEYSMLIHYIYILKQMMLISENIVNKFKQLQQRKERGY